MKALIDTNIILDALLSREPFNKAAEQVILAAAREEYEGFITANSVTDIVYILRKHLEREKLKDAMLKLMDIMEVLDTTKTDCRLAFDGSLSDYEDALLVETAKRAHLDYIVSRDKQLLDSVEGMGSEATPIIPQLITAQRLLSRLETLETGTLSQSPHDKNQR
jgi:predicted nucleic acid-binding protein